MNKTNRDKLIGKESTDLGHQLVRLNSDAILNSIADGVIVMGLDRKILFINPAARKMLAKVGAESLSIGQRCNKAIGHSGCELHCLINSAMKTGKHFYDYEAKLGTEDNFISLSINAALLKDEQGKVIGGIEIFRDNTLIKELKNEIDNKYSFDTIIGKNYRMREVFELLHEVAPTQATVLIEGESGTGKELVANAVHYSSTRKEKSFVKLNCAALSENILESELFGHIKGAFTGAVKDKPGRFEMADGGTLFLDEIGEISPQVQVKLLRVLQEGEFERVGGTNTIKTDVRIIAATNKDLKAEVKRGTFREDLYFRLKVVPVLLPPLRERKEDIPALVKHFIHKFNNEMGLNINNISPSALDVLLDYHYPGNIRELENVLEHAFVRCKGRTILPKHLPGSIRKETEKAKLVGESVKSEKPLKELERKTILKVLNETRWSYQESARKLGIGRTTLWRKMKELDIDKSKALINL